MSELPDEVRLSTSAATPAGAALHWRIRGWKKNTSPEAMRVNVQVRRGDAQADAAQALGTAGYFVDTLDLYAARSRHSFVRAAAVELGCSEDALKHALGAVLLKLETLQDELMTQARLPAGPVAPKALPRQPAAHARRWRAAHRPQRLRADQHLLCI